MVNKKMVRKRENFSGNFGRYNLFFGFVFGIILFSTFTLAAHTVTYVGDGVSNSILQGISTRINISVNNSDSGSAANITVINFTLANGLVFTGGMGTNAFGDFSNASTNNLGWINNTFLINGSSVKNFLFNVSASNPGIYPITITTFNLTGFQTSFLNLTVNDTQKPSPVTLAYPTNGLYFTSKSFTFNASAADNVNVTAIVVEVFNSSEMVNSSTNTTNNLSSYYSGTITVPIDGVYVVNVTANDSAGNTNYSTSATVYVDTTAPSLLVNSPANGSYLNSSTVTISLTVSDLTALNYTNITIYNSTGSIVNSTVNSSSGTYTRTLTVPGEGIYSMVVTAYDNISSQNQSTTTFTVDTTLPNSVAINLPLNGTVQGLSRTVSFNASASDSVGINTIVVRVYNSTSLVNSTNSSIGATGLQGSFVLPRDDTYYFNVSANDSAGNTNFSTTSIIIIDATAPTFTVFSPIAGANLSTTAIQVNITANDTRMYSTTIFQLYYSNGTLANSATNTSFANAGNTSVILTAPADGTYALAITAYDNASNTNVSYRNITVDTTSPVLTIYNPRNGTRYYANETINITVYASDGLLEKIWVNGTNSSMVYTSTYNAILYALMTTNSSSARDIIIMVGANDSLGNTIYQNVTVSFLGTLPTSNITLPNSSLVEIGTENTTTIIVDYNTPLTSVIVGRNYSNTTVYLDMNRLMNNGTVIISNNFTLERNSSSGINFTVFIPANTNMTYGAGWNGQIFVPIQNMGAYTVGDISGGTESVDVVVQTGADVEINFTQPVKIVIAGMAGKRAQWARNSTALINIANECSDVNNPSATLTGGVRECYKSSGTDLVIWTLHFTDFAAVTYTATTSNPHSPGGGSGGLGTSSVVSLVTSAQLSSGYNRAFYQGTTVSFAILNQNHSVRLESLHSTAKTATLIISSTPQNVTMAEGESKKFEITGDSTYDLLVTLVKVLPGSANITLKTISEAVPGTETAPTQNTPSTTTTPAPATGNTGGTTIPPTTPPVKKSMAWVWWVIVIIVIIAVVAVLVVKRKGRH